MNPRSWPALGGQDPKVPGDCTPQEYVEYLEVILKEVRNVDG